MSVFAAARAAAASRRSAREMKLSTRGAAETWGWGGRGRWWGGVGRQTAAGRDCGWGGGDSCTTSPDRALIQSQPMISVRTTGFVWV